MFLNVEDLANERDGRAGSDGADCVKRGGEAEEPGTREAARDVKDSDHGDDECEAGAGTELIPVGGDEEYDAAGEKDGAEDERCDALPFEAGRSEPVEACASCARMRAAVSASRTPADCQRVKSDSMSGMVIGWNDRPGRRGEQVIPDVSEGVKLLPLLCFCG